MRQCTQRRMLLRVTQDTSARNGAYFHSAMLTTYRRTLSMRDTPLCCLLTNSSSGAWFSCMHPESYHFSFRRCLTRGRERHGKMRQIFACSTIRPARPVNRTTGHREPYAANQHPANACVVPLFQSRGHTISAHRQPSLVLVTLWPRPCIQQRDAKSTWSVMEKRFPSKHGTPTTHARAPTPCPAVLSLPRRMPVRSIAPWRACVRESFLFAGAVGCSAIRTAVHSTQTEIKKLNYNLMIPVKNPLFCALLLVFVWPHIWRWGTSRHKEVYARLFASVGPVVMHDLTDRLDATLYAQIKPSWDDLQRHARLTYVMKSISKPDVDWIEEIPGFCGDPDEYKGVFYTPSGSPMTFPPPFSMDNGVTYL
ncbi:hypothetical protein CYLTODRAFT_209847 [Cylindrobasidium torrendii FP15055 ss-10]|uniref:Uncharacterized protein n=1 Tax=Cylindrobasidium torrendii FP15055 ss-10 TaxID=1314674 RepID=A0A0D7ATK0_9AGAR|nr:hypothetical protein CYLTODRAFT_209847 [Cylindrobasidium torrendii FP15055 ss-10]